MPDSPVGQSVASPEITQAWECPYPAAWLRSWERARVAALAVDPEIVRALHWCRIGNVRPRDDSAFTKAKTLGLLAQDSVWRATERGEGVLVALGLLRGEPAPERTSQVVLWAVSEPTPQLVRLWSEWQDESGTLAAKLDEVKEDFESYGDSGPWRYFTTRAWLDIPTIPEPEDDDDY